MLIRFKGTNTKINKQNGNELNYLKKKEKEHHYNTHNMK